MDPQIVVLLAELLYYTKMVAVLFGLMSIFIVVAVIVGR